MGAGLLGGCSGILQEADCFADGQRELSKGGVCGVALEGGV